MEMGGGTKSKTLGLFFWTPYLSQLVAVNNSPYYLLSTVILSTDTIKLCCILQSQILFLSYIVEDYLKEGTDEDSGDDTDEDNIYYYQDCQWCKAIYNSKIMLMNHIYVYIFRRISSPHVSSELLLYNVHSTQCCSFIGMCMLISINLNLMHLFVTLKLMIFINVFIYFSNIVTFKGTIRAFTFIVSLLCSISPVK